MGIEMTADRARARDGASVALVAGTVVLTLGTAYIHSTLGGWLFTLNAIGYATLAVALIVPIALAARFRWLVRLALLGFTLTTIAGWILFGARYDVAYVDKGIEVVLVALLVVGLYRFDGGAAGVIARLRELSAELSGRVRGGR